MPNSSIVQKAKRLHDSISPPNPTSFSTPHNRRVLRQQALDSAIRRNPLRAEEAAHNAVKGENGKAKEKDERHIPL